MEVLDGLNLFRVYLYPSVSDHVSQEFPKSHPEGTLSSVQLQFKFPQNGEDLTQISQMISYPLSLDYYIVYVCLHVLTRLGFKHSGHHSLIGGPCVFQPK